MGTPYLGEVKMISWNFAPKNWALCNGQFLPINQNQPLFSLLGTQYGGNGVTTFALPDLRGRTPIHAGGGYVVGQAGGQEFHTVTISEMTAHNHFVQASTADANSASPVANLLARSPGAPYAPTASSGVVALQASTITSTGGSQPHENRQPFLVVNFVIALTTGVFPTQT